MSKTLTKIRYIRRNFNMSMPAQFNKEEAFLKIHHFILNHRLNLSITVISKRMAATPSPQTSPFSFKTKTTKSKEIKVIHPQWRISLAIHLKFKMDLMLSKRRDWTNTQMFTTRINQVILFNPSKWEWVVKIPRRRLRETLRSQTSLC